MEHLQVWIQHTEGLIAFIYSTSFCFFVRESRVVIDESENVFNMSCI